MRQWKKAGNRNSIVELVGGKVAGALEKKLKVPISSLCTTDNYKAVYCLKTRGDTSKYQGSYPNIQGVKKNVVMFRTIQDANGKILKRSVRFQ